MKNECRIFLLLDATGSMTRDKEKTIKNINNFITEQQEVEGTPAKIKIVTFNETSNVLQEWVDIKDCAFINKDSYITDRMTALLQYSIINIDSLGKELEKLDENEKPKQVIFVIMTDGLENYSDPEYTKEILLEKINHQQEVYKWTFIYLGIGVDGFNEAVSIGVNKRHTYAYDTRAQFMENGLSDVSYSIRSMRTQ